MSSAQRLAREILDTRRLALGHATSPQLTSSAIDGGGLDITDGDGNRIGGLGLGDDGGFVIDYSGGPKPPKPSPPTVTADAGIFRIEWDGSFVNEGDEGVLATSDTDRVEIHASMDENFVPDRVESFGGAFATLDGGSFALGPLPEAGTYYFRLVARSKSAQFSEPSDRVEQELAITSIDLEITDAWLTGEAAQNTADGKNSIWRGSDEPELDPDRPFKDGDIWFEMTEDGKSIPNIWDEDAGAWVGNDDYRQSEIERVQDELRQELDDIIIDGSGTKNFYQSDEPTEGMREGDLWFDSSDSNKPYIYQDGEWITVRDSFSPPGAGEDVFALLDEAGTTKHAIDNQWASIPGFSFTPGVTGVEAKIPAGATAGTATARLPLTGTFNSAGEWQITAEDTIPSNGLGLGGSGSFEFYSPGADPTARIVLRIAPPGMGLLEVVQPLVVKEDKFGSTRTHSMKLEDQNLQILGVYPIAYAWSLFLEVTVDSAPGNRVKGSGQIAYAVGGKGVADNAITTGKIAANAVEADKIKAGAITTEKIAAGAITAESGIIGSINAGTITVGEMDGARIKARSVAADRILIGQGGELIPDQYFDSQGAAWGSTSGSAEFSYSAEAAYSNRKYGVKAVPTPGGSTFYFPFLTGGESNPRIDTQADKKYVVEAWVRRTDGDVSNLTNVDMRMYSYSQPSGGALSNGVASGARVAASNVPPNTWVKLTGTWTSPSPAYTYVSPRLTVYTSGGHPSGAATWHLGMVSMKEQAGATLIEGGAISTEHIRTGAITAESGIIGSIDANVITVGKIMGNQLDADAINGKTITGATVRTASAGARVELTQNGLKQYNSLGQVITDMSLGSFSTVGAISSGGTSESRVIIDRSAYADSAGAAVMFTRPGALTDPGASLAQLAYSAYDSQSNLDDDFGQAGVDGAVTLQAYRSADVSEPSGKSWGSIDLFPGSSTRSGVQLGSSWQPSGSGAHYMDSGIVANGTTLTHHAGRQGGVGMVRVESYADPSTSDAYAYHSARIYRGARSNPSVDSYMEMLGGAQSGTVNSWESGVTGRNGGHAYVKTLTNTNGGWSNAGTATASLVGTHGVSVVAALGELTLSGRSADVTLSGAGSAAQVASVAIYNTTGSSGSVGVNSTGKLYRITSSRRYKQDIAPARSLPSVLDVETRTWIDKADVEALAREAEARAEIGEGPLAGPESAPAAGAPRRYGAIAEEVHDLGLTELVEYDAFGRPDSLDYGKFGVALIPIVREQRDRIEVLESRLEALETA